MKVNENLSIVETETGVFKIERVFSEELSLADMRVILDQIDAGIEKTKKELSEIPVEMAQRTSALEESLKMLDTRREAFEQYRERMLKSTIEAVPDTAQAPEAPKELQ